MYHTCAILILKTFSSHQTPSPPTADVAVLILHTLSSHCTTCCLYCRCDPLCTAHFSPCTANVTYLIMQIFSSHHAPCPPTANVALLILYTLSSHCTTFFSYCRYDTPGTAHSLSLHCRCDIPDTTDFFLTPHTLCSYCKYDLLILQSLSPHSTKLSSCCRCDLPCATHFLYLYCRCGTPDTADFVLTPHTCLPTPHLPFCHCTASPHTAQPSPCNAAATLLVPHFF